MSACSGLHCAGCGGGGAGGLIVAVVAIEGVEWVVEHLAEVLIMGGVAAVLVVAAMVPLFRWADRRDAGRLAEYRALKAAPAYPVPPSPERRAVESRVLHLHFHGVPDGEQARVIRQALGGSGGTPT